MTQKQCRKEKLKQPRTRQDAKRVRNNKPKEPDKERRRRLLVGIIVPTVIGLIPVAIMLISLATDAPFISLREQRTPNTTQKLCLSDRMSDIDWLPPSPPPVALIFEVHDGEPQSNYTLPNSYYRLETRTLDLKNPLFVLPLKLPLKPYRCCPSDKDYKLVQVPPDYIVKCRKEEDGAVTLWPAASHFSTETISVTLIWKKSVPSADNVIDSPELGGNYIRLHIINSNKHHVTYLANVKLPPLSINTTYEINSPDYVIESLQLHVSRTLRICCEGNTQSAFEVNLPILMTMNGAGDFYFDIEILQQQHKILLNQPKFLSSIIRPPTGIEWEPFVGTSPYASMESIVPSTANNSVAVTVAPTRETEPGQIYSIWYSYDGYGERVTAERIWWNEQELANRVKKTAIFSNVPLDTTNRVYFEIRRVGF
jgi:hypothetical protein